MPDRPITSPMNCPVRKAQVCEQVRLQRFALLRLPRKFTSLYESLLDPEQYPPEVLEPEAFSGATAEFCGGPRSCVVEVLWWAEKLCGRSCVVGPRSCVWKLAWWAENLSVEKQTPGK